MEKFRDKYRTKSLRLEGYDYSQEGLYFITVCTKNHVSCFGTVEEGRMKLNSTGKIVAEEWKRTLQKRDRVILGEWVVMPNHFHCIIYLKPKKENGRDASHASQIESKLSSKSSGNGYNPPLQETDHKQNYKNKFGPQRDNISSIIRGFKSSCTRQIRKFGQKSFKWQRGFYDHIIRNQKSLLKIEEYIRENPDRWYDDRYYKKTNQLNDM